MFNLTRLVSATVKVPAIEVLDHERFAYETINKIRGRVLRARGGPNVTAQVSIRLSHEAADLEAVRNELRCPSNGTVPTAIQAVALRELLVEPVRLIPIGLTLWKYPSDRLVSAGKEGRHERVTV